MKRNAVAWAALVVSVAALASSHGLMRPMPAAPEIPAEGQKTAKALSEAFEAVAAFVKPSVVQINIQRKASTINIRPGRPSPGPDGRIDPKDLEDFFRRFFGPDAEPEHEQFSAPTEGTGSGFVYDDKGHILTNNHVVRDAEKITVVFHDGVESAATVVGTDPATDVAVIKVENTSYRPAAKGRSKDLRVGEWVLAVGSPFGLDQTVTAGIISATERNDLLLNGPGSYEDFVQTDASINPGNSGGPLVDMSGRVVGINTAIMTRSRSNAGVGFAIPIDMAANLADKLIKDGKVSRSRLGVVLNPLTPALAKQFGLEPNTKGALVAEVVKGSPADKAGLKQGDVITKFDEVMVSNMASLRNAVAASDAGHSYRLTYLRSGSHKSTEVVPAPESQVSFPVAERDRGSNNHGEAPKPEVDEYGLAVQPLTGELAAQFGYDKNTEGLVVTAVKEDSSAAAAGVEVGDLITKVIKDKKIQPVPSAKEFQSLTAHSNDVALYIQKPGQAGRFVTLSKTKKN